MEIREDLSYIEHPVRVVDRDSKCMCLKLRPSVDSRGSNKPVRPGHVPRDGLSWNSLVLS